MYLAYTYLITNKITNQYYYGFRCKNVKLKRHPEEDLWIKYFTSSKRVKKLIEEYGKESFDIQILLKDADHDKCYSYEQDLIAEHLSEGLCLNGYCRRTGKFSCAGLKKSAETIAKIREANTGQTRSAEARERISLATMGEKNHNYGKHKSEEVKIKIGKSRKNKPGRQQIPETRAKISATMKGHPPHNKGKPRSEAAKAKRRVTMILKSYLDHTPGV